MKRREFLSRMIGTSLAALSLNGISKGQETGFEERARKYLRSIKPSRQRVEDFITGQYGPRDKLPGEIFQYDSGLGWIHHKAIGSTGVDGSKVFYSYEPDGARKVINFPDKPCRIRTYGDSFTHCSQANNNETWEEYLAAHIQEPVRNYGVGGHSVYQAYRRMRKVEKQISGGYIILNIWDDDHYRNLDVWRSIRFGYGSRCGFTLPHLRVDVAKGICKRMENISKTPEYLYKLCNEDYLWRTFKDDPILKMVMAARKGGRNISPALINPVAVTFGIPDEKIADTETAEKIKKIHTEAALFSTQNVVNWVEEFAGDAGKKLMIMLSFGRGNVAKHLSGEPRFDQNFVDWLKDKPYPVIDMRDIFALDYKKHKVDIDQYLAPFYNGHHSHGIKTICGVLKTDYPPYALQAVRSGYVVLAPGWWGWPGRDGHLDRIGDRDKCNVIQMAASMYGINILDLHIQDGRAAVDVLCSLAEVDAKKIGCIGNSYGGRTTMWLTIFDDRIKACVPSGCMNIFRERSLKLSSCAIQYLPGLLQYGDVPELFSLIAPRPMQLQAGEGDKLITPSDREQIKQVVKKAYRLLGAEKNFEYVLHSRGHTFAWNLAAPFFKRHLEIDR